MKRLTCGVLAFAALAAWAATTGVAQPPEGRGGRGSDRPGGSRGAGGAPPRFELGQVLPPFVRDRLELTEDQEEQLKALEKEVRAKLEKILTPEQRKKLRSVRPPMPPQGGPGGGRDAGPGGEGDGPGGRPRRPQGPPPGKDREDRPERRPDDEQARAGGIQWFTTLEAGRAEAARTGRAILLVSAAPHCAGVSGIW
jgi:hypothetical protein